MGNPPGAQTLTEIAEVKFSTSLSPEQIADVRQAIVLWRIEDDYERADRWAQRLSDAEQECSACGGEALPGKRWCDEDGPVFDRSTTRAPPAASALDRAREAVLRHPDWADEALAALAECSERPVEDARQALGLYRDRWWELHGTLIGRRRSA